MTQPHIVYIITKLELGGAQKICLSLFNQLATHGVNTTLITGSHGVLVDAVRDKRNVILLSSFKREISHLAIVNELRAFWSLVCTLKKIKNQHKAVIVHTHSTKAGILGRWAAWLACISTRVHTVHGFAFHQHQRWLPWLLIWAIEAITSLITTHFICVSQADAHTGSQLLPFFSRRWSLIRAAIDTDSFYAARKTSLPKSHNAPFVFGTIACFKPQKNIFDLLRAFELVHNCEPTSKLEIIGDGMLRSNIEQWIADHNLSKAIVLHGWQQHVVSIMNTWNSFVLSSLWEGLPCAVVEARILQLPVISYNTGGISDVIINEKNGLLVPQKKWCLLAEAMLRIMRDTALYTTTKQHPDQLHDFKTTTMVDQHCALYQRLIHF